MIESAKSRGNREWRAGKGRVRRRNKIKKGRRGEERRGGEREGIVEGREMSF